MKDILLVDDDPDCLAVIKTFLMQEAMTVQCAMSGEEALCELREDTFRLMITDFNMPGMDGLVLARKAREMVPHMPVIMCSGGLVSQSPRFAFEAGITKVLEKPFNPVELLSTVRSIVGKEEKKCHGNR